MQNILFKTVIFDKEKYTGAQVTNGTELQILAGMAYYIKFDTKEEAVAALQELHNLMDGNSIKDTIQERVDGIANDMSALISGLKDGSALAALKGFQDKLQSTAQGVKQSAQEKAMEAVFNKVFSTEQSGLNDMISSLGKAMNILFPEDTKEEPKAEEVKPESTESVNTWKRNMSRKFSVDDILKSTAPKAAPTVEDIISSTKLIEDMTTIELRQTIDIFVDDIVNTEKGVDMINSIKLNFGSAAVDDAIVKFKDLVYTICTENADQTFIAVMTTYFL